MDKVDILKQSLRSGLRNTKNKREDNYIHVSNLLNFCPREYWLCMTHGLLYNMDDEHVSIGRLITYEVGRAIETILINALKSSGIYAPVDPIVLSLTPKIQVIGTPDVAVNLGEPLPYLCEIKTTGKDEFDQLVEPYVNHHCQLTLYLWMAAVKKLNFNTTTGYIIYSPKLEKQDPIKVFAITPNTAFIDRIRERLLELKTAVLEGKEVPRKLCNSPIALLAKTCRISKLCFGNG